MTETNSRELVKTRVKESNLFAQTHLDRTPKVDLSFEAFGPHGSEAERDTVAEIFDKPLSEGALLEKDIAVLRRQALMNQLELLHGSLRMQADVRGVIAINKRFLWGNHDRFLLDVRALQSESLWFSSNLQGGVGGSYDVRLKAELAGFTLRHNATAGGFGKKRIRVECVHQMPVEVEVRGNLNFCDFKLTIVGAKENEILFTVQSQTGKMMNRKVVAIDTISEEKRLIILSDEAA